MFLFLMLLSNYGVRELQWIKCLKICQNIKVKKGLQKTKCINHWTGKYIAEISKPAGVWRKLRAEDQSKEITCWRLKLENNLSLSLSLFLSFSLSLFHSHTDTHTYTNTCTHLQMITLSLSLSHTHTHTHTHTCTHLQIHTHS